MENQAQSTASATESEIEHFNLLIHDPPGYIDPSLQDFIFTDITAKQLLSVSEKLAVDYLSPAPIFPGSFPVDATICGLNRRLMVNLACCKRGSSNTQAINIIFLIDTSSPASYLSEKAMEALIGNPESQLPRQLPVMIQSRTVIECYLSPRDKHFSNVNVLGADFLVENGLTLKANYSSKICTLLVEDY